MTIRRFCDMCDLSITEGTRLFTFELTEQPSTASLYGTTLEVDGNEIDTYQYFSDVCESCAKSMYSQML